MSDRDRESSSPESEPTDAGETEAEIDDSAPEALDAVVDALPGSGKLGTSQDDIDDAAGGPMQVP
ncbi:hypothetical protein [Marisediminicola antarctica]|uniref:Uncharacterized protein n=1 Tax=Marisediminicola antarctica TaxID=674079 RepID=A0A7L5AQ82_9MICO|nr:hypothetical protein [Marisediminicola antarctica]QHO70529.1 hypothetical protein BHD05_13605 [Marisediminicola antarctica]